MAGPAQSTTSPIAGATLVAETDRSFLWRRLHSLTGIIPIGAFLLFHIFENMAAIRGPEAYNEAVGKLADLLPPPYFYVIEFAVIALPIAYHGFYGTFLSLEGRPNVGAYPYRRNYMYLLQRVSGVFALVFIIYHIASLRVRVTMMQTGAGLPGHLGYVTYSDVARHFSSNVVLGFYLLGVVASAFHLGNGLNGFCWTWGIAVGERSRKIVEWLGWALFIVLSVPMIHILWSFRQ